MLFELVAGRRPFLGDNYNLLILEIMTRRAPRADEVTPGVDRSIATVIARALEPNRDDRFESTQAFRAALEALSLDETTGVQRVDALREDSATLDAERGMDSVALDATLAADTSSAVSALAAPVLETNAVAIAEAKAALPRETVAPNKRPARGALIAGLVLGALVSVAAVANLSRAGAHQVPPSVVVERGARAPHASEPSSTVPSPVAPRAVTAVTANTVVDAGSLSTAPLARNAPSSTRTRSARATPPAQGTQGSHPVANANSATPTSPAQATTNTPRATPAATPTSPTPTPAASGNSPVGFRPITTYP